MDQGTAASNGTVDPDDFDSMEKAATDGLMLLEVMTVVVALVDFSEGDNADGEPVGC
jgi:hypothetical protein